MHSNRLASSFPVLPDTQSFLHRPHVDHLIIESLKYPLVVVRAAAGFGKSTAVALALKKADVHVLWLQLTELDNLQARLWERLVLAFNAYDEGISQRLLTFGFPGTPASFHQFISMLTLFLKKSDRRYVLVLDDLHHLHDDKILKFIELLGTSFLPNFTMVIITRNKPHFSLSSYIGKHQLARISERELRFSAEDISAYFQNLNIQLDANDLASITEHTDGWIIAITLIGLSIRQGHYINGCVANTAKIDIYKLIETEICSSISPDLLEVLTQVSLLSGVPKGLLAELMGPRQELVDEMRKIGMLVTYDATTDSLQIHNLFREYLREKAEKLPQSRKLELYETTAKWYHKNNNIAAVEYYAKCRNFKEIFNIILSLRVHITPEISESFIGLIDEAPQDLVENTPMISIVKANYLFILNRLEEAKKLLEELSAHHKGQNTSLENNAIIGEIYCTMGLISIVQQTFDFQQCFKKANDCLPNGSQLMFSNLNIAEGLNLCGIRIPKAGELGRYKKAVFESAADINKVLNGKGYGIEHLVACDADFVMGNLKAAESSAYKAIFISQENRLCETELMSYFYLIRIYLSKGNYAEIEKIFSYLDSKSDQLQQPFCLYIRDIAKGWFYTAIGRTDLVPGWIMYHDKIRQKIFPVVLGRECLVRSNCYLAEERYPELMAYNETKEELYAARGLLYAIIQNRITEAIAYHYLKDYSSSLDALHKAYELSQANQLVMQYIEYGNKMRTLIKAVRRNPQCKIPEEWLDMIYTKANTYGKMLSQVTAEFNLANPSGSISGPRLSKREQEVLEHLCRGLTREEIANACNLSANTIKTILISTFNKLGASNSRDAVHIANQLKLV